MPRRLAQDGRDGIGQADVRAGKVEEVGDPVVDGRDTSRLPGGAALFALPLRPATGRVISLVMLTGLDWPTPDFSTHFSTLCRRQCGAAPSACERPVNDL